jgi:hypothetical protein
MKSKTKQAAIKEMARLKRQGKSLRAIAQAMRENGFNMSHVTVNAALKRHEPRLST